jgi:UDP-glucose 4-epimerase
MPLKGAYRTVIGIFQDLKKQDKPLTITNDGTQRRDFTYVKDVVKANILAMTNPNVGNGEIFNIGNGNNYSVNEIAAAFGRPVEFIGNVIEPKITLADNSKAKKILGWKTTQDVLEWIVNNAI